jgi:hypothetical protein
MNALWGIAIATSIIHGLLYDWTYWQLYFKWTLYYAIFSLAWSYMQMNPKFKHIWASSWAGKSTETDHFRIAKSVWIYH